MKMEPVRQFEAAQPVIDFSNPSLRGLSYRLRCGDFGWEWHYAYTGQCAMRLAVDMWGKWIFPLHAAFNISRDESEVIFCTLGVKLGIGNARVTPEMVADAIDELLARQ